MRDQEFLRTFEDCALPAEGFRHRDHVRAGWIYLRTRPLLAALADFSAALRRFAESKGAAQIYHETITCAYLLLIHERLERGGRGLSWEEFATQNADLIERGRVLLEGYYLEETLRSDAARKAFVLPDRAPLVAG